MYRLKVNKLSSIDRRLCLIALVIGVLAFFFFNTLVRTVSTDIQIHAIQVVGLNDGQSSIPPNFLYYLVVWIFSGFSSNIEVIKIASVVVLSLAVVFKFIVNQYIIKDYLERKLSQNLSGQRLYIVWGVSFLLLVVFALPDAWYFSSNKQFVYLGRLVPNVWHNSTVIFLMPFALLLFWEQYCILFFGKKINLVKLVVLIALNIFIKPSFLFIYILVVPFYSLYYFRLSKPFWLNILTLLIGGGILLLQTYLIYSLNYGSLSAGGSKVVIGDYPFIVWYILMPANYILNGLLCTFALPLVFILLYNRAILREPQLIFFVFNLGLASMLWFAFVVEDGARFIHGNFIWQCIIASYLIFLAVAMEILKGLFTLEKQFSWKLSVLSILFVCHFIAGCAYIYHILSSRSYY